MNAAWKDVKITSNGLCKEREDVWIKNGGRAIELFRVRQNVHTGTGGRIHRNHRKIRAQIFQGILHTLQFIRKQYGGILNGQIVEMFCGYVSQRQMMIVN